MENITIQDILEATDGTLLCGDPSMKIDHLSTNSMEIGPNTLFVPIIGERVDAHIFIPNALKEGGACLTQEHTEASGNAPYIKVPDTLTAMQQIAAYYRNKMSLPIIGVTGSVGKTTTREMIAHVLKGKYKVFETIGNQNSQVGVPLTLDHLTSEDEIGVLEMGMSEKGQITTLGNIIHPNVGVVTNVGVSHIEMMGSRDNICIEKLDIQNGLPEDGVLFLNGDNDMIRKHIDYVKKPYEFYGFADDCTYRAEKIREKGGQTLFEFHYGDMKEPITLNVLGKHNVSNALAAIAIGLRYDVPMSAIKAQLSTFSGQRQNIIHVNDYILIDDAYNASPMSTKAALENLTKPTLNILGLGALLIKRIKPYAVSFKYAEDKTMSAVISSMFYVPSADREIVVNTPLMKCPSDEVEASQAGFFNQETVDALWAFEQEARKYLDGKRSQISLFGEDTEAETTANDVSVVDVPKPNNVVQMPTVAQ